MVRFSTVSKAWHSMIFDAKFAKRHNSSSRPAVMIATLSIGGTLSSIYRCRIIGTGHEKPLNFPFDRHRVRKLTLPMEPPDLSAIWPPHNFLLPYNFGAGYDSVADDYKVLSFKFGQPSGHLYSLRSDTWKETEAFPGGLVLQHAEEGGVAVSGALHWPARAHPDEHMVIVSFDLWAEKYI